jgi:hypothetical protein
MSLTDVMSSMDLAVYPQIALVLFLGVFAAVSIRTLRRGSADELRRGSRLPLEEEDGADLAGVRGPDRAMNGSAEIGGMR